MTSLLAERRGVQQPRVLLTPQGIVSSSGPEATELAAACGLILDVAQAGHLDVSMGERADGSWAAAEVGLIASRQNGKNGEVEARELYGLAVLNEWIIHTSHLFKTTRESYDRLLTLIHANPDVRDCLTHNVASPASGYEMRFRGGGRITFIARSRSSGRGLTGDLLIFDEAQDLHDDAQGALLPTISARPGAQAWYLGSAPDIGSTVFHRIRKRGRRGEETRLAYFEHSADPDCDPDDEEAWAQANWAYNIRIMREAVRSERLSMSRELFLRERLSVSPDIDELEGVFSIEDWAAACDPNLELDMPSAACFGVDMNPERSYGGIVAGKGTEIEVVAYAAGVGWLEDRATELWRKYGKPFVIDAKGPAGSLIVPLENRGVKVIPFTTDEMTKATGDFYDRVINRTVKVRTNTDLNRAVAGAAKRAVGDAFCWGRKSSKDDISLLVAATAAGWHATHGGTVELMAAWG
jgi:hypothetical protein